MSHPIGAVPSIMFHETIRTNANSELTSVLKNQAALVCEISVVPSKTVYIRDAMDLIQMIDGNQHKTFDDLGKFYAKLLLQHFNKADTVIEVIYRYNTKLSVKADERARRAEYDANNKIYSVHGGRPVPPWKKFPEVFVNKQCLMQFLCGYSSNAGQDFVHKHPAKSVYLYVGGGGGR